MLISWSTKGLLLNKFTLFLRSEKFSYSVSFSRLPFPHAGCKDPAKHKDSVKLFQRPFNNSVRSPGFWLPAADSGYWAEMPVMSSSVLKEEIRCVTPRSRVQAR